MSDTGVRVFNETLQITHVWLNDIMKALGWDDRERTLRLLRATLHVLRDRLPVDEAVHLGAQLPMLLRGLYYEDWHPAGTPTRQRTREAFLEPIAAAFSRDPTMDPEAGARAVFTALAKHVSAGEVEDVRHMLPAEVRELWPGERTEA